MDSNIYFTIIMSGPAYIEPRIPMPTPKNMHRMYDTFSIKAREKYDRNKATFTCPHPIPSTEVVKQK